MAVPVQIAGRDPGSEKRRSAEGSGRLEGPIAVAQDDDEAGGGGDRQVELAIAIEIGGHQLGIQPGQGSQHAGVEHAAAFPGEQPDAALADSSNVGDAVAVEVPQDKVGYRSVRSRWVEDCGLEGAVAIPEAYTNPVRRLALDRTSDDDQVDLAVTVQVGHSHVK